MSRHAGPCLVLGATGERCCQPAGQRQAREATWLDMLDAQDSATAYREIRRERARWQGEADGPQSDGRNSR
jgi:hypothetical protein